MSEFFKNLKQCNFLPFIVKTLSFIKVQAYFSRKLIIKAKMDAICMVFEKYYAKPVIFAKYCEKLPFFA